jgi:hypothetical protein
MPNVEQSGLVLALADALGKRGSWAGETHVQKASYLLQHLLRVPLGFKYILYKHGPFSFDLRGAISEMEADDYIRWEPKPYPYGPSLQPGPNASYVLATSKYLRAFQGQIEFTAEKLAGKNVAALERLATALYVSLEVGSAATRAQRIHALKPHVSLQQAEAAVIEIDRIRGEAEQRHLVVAGRQASCEN